jgi:RNase P subunit RPR2
MLRWLGIITSAMHRSHTGARERRAVDRILAPACPGCHSHGNMRVRSRSSYAVYFNCRQCGEIIILNKPKA